LRFNVSNGAVALDALELTVELTFGCTTSSRFSITMELLVCELLENEETGAVGTGLFIPLSLKLKIVHYFL
jgi:hypothetical protein